MLYIRNGTRDVEASLTQRAKKMRFSLARALFARLFTVHQTFHFLSSLLTVWLRKPSLTEWFVESSFSFFSPSSSVNLTNLIDCLNFSSSSVSFLNPHLFLLVVSLFQFVCPIPRKNNSGNSSSFTRTLSLLFLLFALRIGTRPAERLRRQTQTLARPVFQFNVSFIFISFFNIPFFGCRWKAICFSFSS